VTDEPGGALSGAAVLVVEDEFLIAAHLAMLLQQAGCRVVGPADSIAAAEALLASDQPDAAFLDIALGRRETSFGIADKLAEQNTPFAFLSAYSREDVPGRFAAYPVLTKPYSFAAVEEMARSLLQR
jgi:DNA-binding response OmpR family regulator